MAPSFPNFIGSINRFMISIVVLITLLITTGCAPSSVPNEIHSSTPLATKTINPSSTVTTAPQLTATDSPLPTETPIPTQTTLPTKTLALTATATPLPEGVEVVQFKTKDGLQLVGYLHKPTGGSLNGTAVLLAHEHNASHLYWEPIANLLAEAGFTILNIDFRGHGSSPGNFSFEWIDTDVIAGIDYLNASGYIDIICMGASMGGTGCLAATTSREIIGLVMLAAPWKIPDGPEIEKEHLQTLEIPKVFMIAEDDIANMGTPGFTKDFLKMAEISGEPKQTYIYEGYAHGTGLLLGEQGNGAKEIVLDFARGFMTDRQVETNLASFDCTSAGLPETACSGVTYNFEWTPVYQEIDGVNMVLVPAGCFSMGNDTGKSDEAPAHRQCFERPFWVDQTEVTVDLYARFMNAEGKTIDELPIWETAASVQFIQIVKKDGVWVPAPGNKNRPMEAMEFANAVELCAWRGGHLLTEAEWEYAARGPDSWIYPWGNEFNPENVVRVYEKVPEVGSKPGGDSWVGAQDMSSSLYEWVSSIYLPYPYDALDGREASLEADSTSERILKSGAWYHSDGMKDDLRATLRRHIPTWYVAWYFGFRCGLSIDP
jgi:iron(II)-dependent oxidoreductase